MIYVLEMQREKIANSLQHVCELLGFKKIEIHENSWKNQLGELQTTIDYELKVSDFCNAKLID